MTSRPTRRALAVGGLIMLWSAPVCAAIFVAAPFEVMDARALTAELLGAESSRYFGYCPMPLVVYFFAALVVRHPLALALGVCARNVGPLPSIRVLTRAMLEAYCVWLVLAFGGALVVVAATGLDEASFQWAIEAAQLTALAGLPCVTVALSSALWTKKPEVFWLITPMLLTIFAMLSLGLNGEWIPPVLPGRIDAALTSGREALRSRATLGAIAWPVFGWLAVTLRAVRSSSGVRQTPRREEAGSQV